MPLTCSCDFDWDDHSWWYEPPDDYSTLNTKRRHRCSSCKQLIDLGSIITKFTRFRYPRGEVELRIHNYDEEAWINLAPKYLCEECSDLFWSFDELGFECISPDENMRELALQYNEADYR